MKLLTPKKIPNKIIDFIFMAYQWGYSDSVKNLPQKTREQVKQELSQGYNQAIQRKA